MNNLLDEFNKAVKERMENTITELVEEFKYATFKSANPIIKLSMDSHYYLHHILASIEHAYIINNKAETEAEILHEWKESCPELEVVLKRFTP